MVNYHNSLYNELKTSFPNVEVKYELFVDSSTSLPCITYCGASNISYLTGDTLSFSNVSYYVKVWGNSLAETLPIMEDVDDKMKELGFVRESYNELSFNTQICLISLYRGIGYEIEMEN